MAKKRDNRSIHERLNAVGITVTDKKYGGWNNAKRMLVDKGGNELGFFSPLNALNEFNA